MKSLLIFFFLIKLIYRISHTVLLHRGSSVTTMCTHRLFKLSAASVTVQIIILTAALTVVDTKAKVIISSYMLMCIYKFKDNNALSTSLIIQTGPLTEKTLYKTLLLLAIYYWKCPMCKKGLFASN